MTVRELIEKLNEFPQDKTVVVCTCIYHQIEGIVVYDDLHYGNPVVIEVSS